MTSSLPSLRCSAYQFFASMFYLRDVESKWMSLSRVLMTTLLCNDQIFSASPGGVSNMGKSFDRWLPVLRCCSVYQDSVDSQHFHSILRILVDLWMVECEIVWLREISLHFWLSVWLMSVLFVKANFAWVREPVKLQYLTATAKDEATDVGGGTGDENPQSATSTHRRHFGVRVRTYCTPIRSLEDLAKRTSCTTFKAWCLNMSRGKLDVPYSQFCRSEAIPFLSPLITEVQLLWSDAFSKHNLQYLLDFAPLIVLKSLAAHETLTKVCKTFSRNVKGGAN